MTVVDTSVFVDALFRFNEERSSIASKTFEVLQERGITILEPEIFKMELIGQLVRRIPKREAVVIYEEIVSKVNIIEFKVLNEVAFSICFETGCRAIDAYFIATAKLTNSILITNDRIMAVNAKKAGIEAYYLLEEFDAAMRRLSEL